MNRIIKCVKEIHGEYITVDIEYTYVLRNGNVYYNRVEFPHSGSFMSIIRFELALRNGAIIFTDNIVADAELETK